MSWRSSKEDRPKAKRGLALCDPELRRQISRLGGLTLCALGLNYSTRVTAGMTDEEKRERRRALDRRRWALKKLARARAEARARRLKERGEAA